MENPAPRRGLAPAEPVSMASLIRVQPGAVVSREILKRPTGTVTIFSMDEGQGLSEHTSPYDALIQVLEGEAVITIAGTAHRVHAGEIILLPANQPHAVSAASAFTMVLTMIRS